MSSATAVNLERATRLNNGKERHRENFKAGLQSDLNAALTDWLQAT